MTALRLVWALLCFCAALLCVVPAQTYFLWQLTVLATEFSIWLVSAALLTLLPGWRRSRPTRAAALVGAAAALLAATPLLRALPAARSAQDRIGAAFGDTEGKPFRLWRTLAAPAAGDAKPETVVYTRSAGGERRLDLYRPPSGRPAPVVLVIHGGSWRAGDRTQLAGFNRLLVERGYAVAAIDYRLAPASPFPAASEDVRAAVQFLRREARRLGIDGDRQVLLGRSAGGHLALLAAYREPDSVIKGVISFYGPTDLRWAWHHPSNPRVLDSNQVLRDFMGGPLESKAAAYERASPLRYVGSAVPTLLVHGGRDELVFAENAHRLAAALKQKNIRHAYVELPWATHACDYTLKGPCGQISSWSVLHFLRAVTSPGNGAARP